MVQYRGVLRAGADVRECGSVELRRCGKKHHRGAVAGDVQHGDEQDDYDQGVARAGTAAAGSEYFQYGLFFGDQYHGKFTDIWAGDRSRNYAAGDDGGAVPVLRVRVGKKD